MRSNEVAKLAGVSVRTLRHYHAIGLLDEPPRSGNGYRDYRPADLARVLRIRRLASLGFPLARIGEVLASMDAAASADAAAEDGRAPSESENRARADAFAGADALDRLDCELAAQIERLQEQRRTIALLKREQLDPDLPVRFARAVRSLAADVGESGPADAKEREMLVLAGNLYAEKDLAELERIANRVRADGLAETLEDINRRVERLAPDASLRERAALADEAVEALSPLADEFDAESWNLPYTLVEKSIIDASMAYLNEAQIEVMALIEQGMRALSTRKGPSRDLQDGPRS